MKALLLSAGRGERLRPLTDEIPKPLIRIGGRPLIDYALAVLRRGGVTDVAINVHHLSGRMTRSLVEAPEGIRITWAPEPELLGTGGPLAGLADFFGGEPFIVMNSDTILDLDIARLAEFHRENQALATFVLRPIVQPGAYSEIQADSSGRIVRMRLLIDRKSGRFEDYSIGASNSAVTAYMYCGAAICEPEAARMAVRPPPSSLMGDLFAPALKKGARLFGFVHHGFFRTVDDLAAYEELRREFDNSPPKLRYIG
ncbi:MAG: nucleotidyltransferase family protein [Candidatus Binataceae bacterium]